MVAAGARTTREITARPYKVPRPLLAAAINRFKERRRKMNRRRSENSVRSVSQPIAARIRIHPHPLITANFADPASGVARGFARMLCLFSVRCTWFRRFPIQNRDVGCPEIAGGCTSSGYAVLSSVSEMEHSLWQASRFILQLSRLAPRCSKAGIYASLKLTRCAMVTVSSCNVR